MLPSTARIGAVPSSVHEEPGTDKSGASLSEPTPRTRDRFPGLPSKAVATEHSIDLGPRDQPHIRTRVSILGFASDLTLDNRLRDSNPPHTYRVTGHVGYSLDGGDTIFGFGPCVPEDIDAQEAVHRLALGATFPGMVTDDTQVFNSVAMTPKHPASKAPEPQIVYKQDIPLSVEQFDAVKSEHDSRPLGQPIAEIRYGFPFPNTNAFNCATYPSTLGIALPHPEGILARYIPKLAENGDVWIPRLTSRRSIGNIGPIGPI